jgi:hypothetical protein
MASQAFQIYPMKKSFIIICLQLCCFYFAKSQTIFPESKDNPVWNIGLWAFFDNVLDYTIRVEKDTFLCQKTWSKAIIDLVVGKRVQSIFYRVEGQKVYFKPTANCSQLEILIYDFAMKKGDTLLVPNNLFENRGEVNINKVVVRVDSVSTISLGGASRRKLSLTYRFVHRTGIEIKEDRTDTWVEGFGSSIFPFYPLFCVNKGVCTESNLYVRCFQAINKIIYQDSRSPFCSNAIITSNSDVQNPKINLNIYPNPIPQGGNWQVEWAKNELKASQLDLLDPLGRVLKQMSDIDRGYMQRVQVSSGDLPKGLYYLRMKDEKGQVLALEKVMVQ